MNTLRIIRSHPLAAAIGVFLLIVVSSAPFDGNDLESDMISTTINACIASVGSFLCFPYLWTKKFRAQNNAEEFLNRFALSNQEEKSEAHEVVLIGIVILTSGLIGGLIWLVTNFENGDIHNVAYRMLCGVAVCITTAIFEEAYFRGMIFPGIFRVRLKETNGTQRQRAWSFAAVQSALLFGLLHGVDIFSLLGTITGAQELTWGIYIIQGVLKIIQAFLFGFCMAVLVMRTSRLLEVVVIHAMFDMLYLGPYVVCKGMIPATYLTGNVADIGTLAITTCMLAGGALYCVKHLMSTS